MTSVAPARKSNKPSAKRPLFPRLVRISLLILLDMAVFWFLNQLVRLGYYPMAAAALVLAIFVNYVLIRQEAYPLRWMIVGLILMSLFTIYPIIFTFWVSFSNYGEGHLITEEQAIEQILKAKYLPETGKAYQWTAFKSPAGDYALWLTDAEGTNFLAKPGELIEDPQSGQDGIGALDENGIPVSIECYQRLNAIMATAD